MPKMKGYGNSSAKGLYSYKDNPIGKAKAVSPMVGPSANKDAQKANKLLQKAQMQEDSLRGSAGKM